MRKFRLKCRRIAAFDSINPMLLGLNPNSFLPMGATPGTVSLCEGNSGKGIKLEIDSNQLASHIVMFSIAPEMPTMLCGRVQGET